MVILSVLCWHYLSVHLSPIMKTARRKKPSRAPNHPLLAHELYLYDVVGRGLARTFYQEFERKQTASFGKDVHVEFRFDDVVFFLAKAAAEGVAGNLAYDALRRLVAIVRKPKEEIGRSTFSAVIKRKTYERLLERRRRVGKNPSSTVAVRQKLEKQYELMVSVRWKYLKRL